MNNCQAKAPPTTNRGKSNQNDVSLQNLKRVCGTDGWQQKMKVAK